MLWLSSLFLKLFSFTGTHSTRRGKSSHQRNRLLGLDSQTEQASAFDGSQGSARMWRSRNCICCSSATKGKLQEGCLWWPLGLSAPCRGCDRVPRLLWPCWRVPTAWCREPGSGAKSRIVLLAPSAVSHQLSFSSWFWSWAREDLQCWEWTHRHLMRCLPESYTTTSFFKNQEYCYNFDCVGWSIWQTHQLPTSSCLPITVGEDWQ